MGRLPAFLASLMSAIQRPGRFAPMLLMVVACLFATARASAQDGFLDPDKAFHFDARVADAEHVEVSFDIAPGYYMYREQFKFSAQGATLGEPALPAGHVKFDQTFQKDVETYRDRLLIGVPVTALASGSFVIDVVGQGCSDKGICYPPAVHHARVQMVGRDGSPGSVKVLASTPYMPGAPNEGGIGAALSGSASSGGLDVAAAAGPSGSPGAIGSTGSGAGAINTALPRGAAPLVDSVQAALQSGRVLSVVGVFLLAGVLLSLTPCVLPMLPILSSIIVGEEARASAGQGSVPKADWATRVRTLLLAVSYSLGMALVYTALGVAAGLAGEGLAAALQKPWVLGLFALGLALLALSMFGVYELRLPAAFTGRVTAASTRLKGGRIAGVFLMGGISALIVSPCVAAPLAGALVYISQTRDATLGGIALFSLAAGMSVPLLLVGISAGALLPRAGAWMDTVKRLFGVLLLGVAIWIVQPLLPASLVLALWGVLLIGGAVALGMLDPALRRSLAPRARIRRSAAMLLAIFGVVQIVGAVSGGTDPLKPLDHWGRREASVTDGLPPFVAIRSSAELDEALRNSAGRPVMLDFYADWCVTCKEMERFTYPDEGVKAKLAGALLLKADVTRNSPEDRELLRRFNLFGPPATLFFDKTGQEKQDARVIGFEPVGRFIDSLTAAGL